MTSPDKKFVFLFQKEKDWIIFETWAPMKFPDTTLSMKKGVKVLPKEAIKMWPEFTDDMQNGDVIVTIEHCCHCKKHAEITHHKEDHYLSVKFILFF